MSLARDNSRVARQGLVVVSTAQALRDLVWFGNNPPDGIQTLGAATEGDGGGGFWRWDNSSQADDNLSTVLLPTDHSGDGRWVRSIASWDIIANTAVEIGDATNSINTTNKIVGKQVFDSTNLLPLWSTGDQPTDPWNDAAGIISITPV